MLSNALKLAAIFRPDIRMEKSSLLLRTVQKNKRDIPTLIPNIGKNTI